MFTVQQGCQVDECNRLASARCFCCDKNVCTRHFSAHIDAVKAQIDPVANDINSMVEKIQGLTIEQITETNLTRLKQWKMDMHQLIDEIFLTKTNEIEELIAKKREKFNEHKKNQFDIIMKAQDEVKQLAEDGDATYTQIQSLKHQLATSEANLKSFEEDFVSVDTKLLTQDLILISSKFNQPTVSKSLFLGSTSTFPFPFASTTSAASTSLFETPQTATTDSSIRNPYAINNDCSSTAPRRITRGRRT